MNFLTKLWNHRKASKDVVPAKDIEQSGLAFTRGYKAYSRGDFYNASTKEFEQYGYTYFENWLSGYNLAEDEALVWKA
jgi:hypothetical protein